MMSETLLNTNIFFDAFPYVFTWSVYYVTIRIQLTRLIWKFSIVHQHELSLNVHVLNVFCLVQPEVFLPWPQSQHCFSNLVKENNHSNHRDAFIGIDSYYLETKHTGCILQEKKKADNVKNKERMKWLIKIVKSEEH